MENNKNQQELFEIKCGCCGDQEKDHHGPDHDDHHDHDHTHNHEHASNKMIIPRLVVGGLLLILAVVAPRIFSSGLIELILYLSAFLVVGYDIVWSAIRNVFKGQMLDENFLMCIAAMGAFAIGEHPEGVAVMLFYQVGEYFQDRAVDKSKRSISELMDIRPDYANALPHDAGSSGNPYSYDDFIKISPEELEIGDIILIKPGEKVPVDAKIIMGNSTVDTSALTGESLPRDVGVGSDLLSGSVNINGLIEAKVSKPFSQSTAAKILDLVQNAGTRKSKSEQFITKFARYYTPAVVGVAVFLAIVPPLLIPNAAFQDWLYRALTFLVVSCPCALVISVPLSFFGGIGGASKHGILVKGGNYLEALSRAETVVFDKTGTLTKGVFNVAKISPVGIDEDELLKIAAHAENFSNHPISVSLRKAYGKDINVDTISNVEEIPGHGIKASVAGKIILAGNGKLMSSAGLSDKIKAAENEIGTIVHIAIENIYAGYIVISDEIKTDAKLAISDLKKLGITTTVMLTGDAKKVADLVGADLGLDQIYSELLPGDKVDISEQLLAKKSAKGSLLFVGDGINDAPVLARADVGIAMGGVGSDAAIEAADIVIMTDEPSKVATAIKISKRTIAIANQNIAFALGVKAIVLALSAFGFASMWMAIFADVGVSILAVLNAIRALNTKA